MSADMVCKAKKRRRLLTSKFVSTLASSSLAAFRSPAAGESRGQLLGRRRDCSPWCRSVPGWMVLCTLTLTQSHSKTLAAKSMEASLLLCSRGSKAPRAPSAFERQELQAAASEAWGEGRPDRTALSAIQSQSIGGWISESESAHLAVLGGEALPFSDCTVWALSWAWDRVRQTGTLPSFARQMGAGSSRPCSRSLSFVAPCKFQAVTNAGTDGPSLFAPSFCGTWRSCGAAA